jgi:hypothetical protein
MQLAKNTADRLLALFVPQREAKAIYIWFYYCTRAVECSYDQVTWYPTYWKKYCHESSGGGCTNHTLIGCCG